MTERQGKRSWLSMFSVALLGVLMLSLVAACGSDEDDDDDADTDAATTVTATSATGGAGATEDDTATEAATEADTDDSTPGGAGMGEAMAIGACIESNTTGDIVTDLRDGETEGAEDIYRECLGEALPASMVDQLDPIIDQAGDCGSEASADLSDDDIAAIESGDETTIQQVTNDTLTCLSDELGIDLQ